MSTILKIDSIVFLVFVCFVILFLVKKEKITVKYSIVWLIPCILLILFVLLPGFLSWITSFLGFYTASNMIFALLIGFLLLITITLTVIVSKQKNQIRLLIQEISMMKDSKNEK